MSIKFTHNPFDVVISIAEQLYPEIECEIVFGNVEGGVAYTAFPDDGSAPQIVIDPDGSFRQITQLIGHEIAHVVAGKKAKHGPDWKRVFHTIEKAYNDYFDELEN